MSQLEHWVKVMDRHTAVGAFLEWLEVEYGVILDWNYADANTPPGISQIIDEFFEVDQKKLYNERRELLEKGMG